MLLDELMKIPADATSATIEGVEMQVIDAEHAQSMLDTDPSGEKILECQLANGRFIYESESRKLKTLYKVM